MGRRLCPCDGGYCSLIKLIKLGSGLVCYMFSIAATVCISHYMNKIKISILMLNLSTTAMSARVERHTKVIGPE